MEQRELLALLERVRSGSASPEEAAALIGSPAYEDLGYARVDHHRAQRQGAAEVIFGQGKTAEQIAGIVRSMMDRGTKNILITRLSPEKEALLRGKVPYRYSAQARLAVANPAERPLTGDIAVVSAGTSDLAVCEEAALTAEALGSRVHRVYDAGVAGLHRLLGSLPVLEQARATSMTVSTLSTSFSPAPPYSLGTLRPKRPSLHSFMVVSLGNSPVRSSSSARGVISFSENSRTILISIWRSLLSSNNVVTPILSGSRHQGHRCQF